MTGHAYRGGVRFRSLRGLPVCDICGKGPGDPVHLMTFAGMEQDVIAQAESAAALEGEELTRRMREPLGDVSAKAGRIENDSPLFFGKINPTLF